MENYNALIDVAEEWLDSNACAEFEAWLDSQEVYYPVPSDVIDCEDYDDDF
jgi:hypothetical protein